MIGIGIVLFLLAIFALWPTSLAGNLLQEWDARSSIYSAGMAALGLAITIYGVILNRRMLPDVATVERFISHFLEKEYGAKSYLRGIADPEPLVIQWAPAALQHDVTFNSSQIVKGGRERNLSTLAAGFLELKERQLVILGEPGSGKSVMCLLLALELLRARGRESGDSQIPLVVSLIGWRPSHEKGAQHSFGVWLAAQLEAQCPQLRRDYGTRAAITLVENGCILPIFDGLDELPEQTRLEALKVLAKSGAEGLPLIVASRLKPYQKAVKSSKFMLKRAAVVELKPLHYTATLEFLAAGEKRSGRSRWDRVENRIKSGQGPLASVLSSPLMAYLARTAYESPGSDPEDLVNKGREEEIIKHLYASYLPALYGDSRRAMRAQEHFGLLAAHLQASNKAIDLAWWRLFLLVPNVRPISSITVGSFGMIAFWAQYGFWAGLIVSALLAALWSELMKGNPPRHLWFDVRRILGSLLAGGVVGALASLLVATELRPIVIVTIGATVAFVTLSMLSMVAPKDSSAVEPRDILANQRALVFGIIVFLGLAASVRSGFQYDATRAVIDGIQTFTLGGTVLLTMFGASWITYTIAKIWLVVRWRFPLRLLTFLEEAHELGLLRRSGPFYQFRHREIQLYLAETRAR
ncbi:NACHT domain-containing protein [Streptosporangium oxazolinicum]|uniref:NACHT domain-containing protein n=1 Tax=Streptosporangium oxazolinicum TaxID=909287 RepID=UPI0031ED51F7